MKALWWILGTILSLAGLGWIIVLMGEVLSQSEGFTYFSAQFWGYLIFHTVAMGLGLMFFDLAVKGKRVAQSSKK